MTNAKAIPPTGTALADLIERTAGALPMTLKALLRECDVHWSTFARWRLGETNPWPRTHQRVLQRIEALWQNR